MSVSDSGVRADAQDRLTPVKLAAFCFGFLLLVFSYFFYAGDPESAKWGMAAIVATMALWWVFEVLPLGVTALVPLVAYPLMGVMKTSKVAPVYMSSTIFVFMGGFFLALAMQRWNLHKRIALKIILLFGNSPSRIVLGFMCACCFLSMWISNVATTVMIVAVGLAVIRNLEDLPISGEDERNISACLMLAVAHAATAGGMATLVGTPPNLIFSRVYALTFPHLEEISFGKWMLFGLPCSIVIFGIIFVVLYLFYLKNLSVTHIPSDYLENELKKMGKMSYEEKIVLLFFVALAFLWIFRKPLDVGVFTIPGWSQLFSNGKLVDDGTVAILCSLGLFLLPAKNKEQGGGRILAQEDISKMPWDAILLLGGGFAIAKGMMSSGLSEFFGTKLQVLSGLPTMGLMLSLAGGVSFITELTSNTASTEIILPIIAAAAKSLNINALLLMVPATLAASCAFMLPMATGPNTVIFCSGKVTIWQMAKTGFWINCFSFVFVALWCSIVV